MTAMLDKDRERYRRKLLGLRQRLRGEIDHMSETVLADARARGEHDRRVSESVDKEVSLELNEERIRKEVADALARIDAGTYGVCEMCGRPISRARLDALPYSPYCLKCEEQAERA